MHVDDVRDMISTLASGNLHADDRVPDGAADELSLFRPCWVPFPTCVSFLQHRFMQAHYRHFVMATTDRF